jgi:hypothetical protein
MPQIVIRNHKSGAVLFSGKFVDMRAAVEAAVCDRVDLEFANLSSANLIGAKLSEARLSGASLVYANLINADLSRADLSGANLCGANLYSATFAYANLAGAHLANTNIARTNFAYSLWGTNIKLHRTPISQVTRSDGQRFLLLDTFQGWMVKADNKLFPLTNAWKYWKNAYMDDKLKEETFDIISLFERSADRRTPK